jgi:hypothetical protein
MTKTLTLKTYDWDKLKSKITEDYGLTTVLISWRMREQLGFTVREHYEPTEVNWRLANTVRLDFWDDQLQTMFLLRYADYLTPGVEQDVY